MFDEAETTNPCFKIGEVVFKEMSAQGVATWAFLLAAMSLVIADFIYGKGVLELDQQSSNFSFQWTHWERREPTLATGW